MNDGKIYTYSSTFTANQRGKLYRFTQDGKPDLTFGNKTNYVALADILPGSINVVNSIRFQNDTIVITTYNEGNLAITFYLTNGTLITQTSIRDPFLNIDDRERIYSMVQWLNPLGEITGIYNSIGSSTNRYIKFTLTNGEIQLRNLSGFLPSLVDNDTLVGKPLNLIILGDKLYGKCVRRTMNLDSSIQITGYTYRLNMDLELDLAFAQNGFFQMKDSFYGTGLYVATSNGIRLYDKNTWIHLTLSGEIDSTQGINGYQTYYHPKGTFKLGDNTYILFENIYHTEDKVSQWFATLREKDGSLITSFEQNGYWPDEGIYNGSPGYLNTSFLLENNVLLVYIVSNNWKSFFYKYYVTGYVLGADELKPNKDLSLYPNPAHDLLHLKGQSTDILNYTILNVRGQVMKEDILNSRTIEISDLESGFYFLRLDHKSNKSIIHKFIKQ